MDQQRAKVFCIFFHLPIQQTVDLLKRKIERRPDKQVLINRRILRENKSGASPFIQEKCHALKKNQLRETLNSKLEQRPGSLELVEKGVLQVHPGLATLIRRGSIPYPRVASSTISKCDIPEEALLTTITTTSVPSPPRPPTTRSPSDSDQSGPRAQATVRSSQSRSATKAPSRSLKDETVIYRYGSLVFHNYRPNSSSGSATTTSASNSTLPSEVRKQRAREAQQAELLQLQDTDQARRRIGQEICQLNGQRPAVLRHMKPPSFSPLPSSSDCVSWLSASVQTEPSQPFCVPLDANAPAPSPNLSPLIPVTAVAAAATVTTSPSASILPAKPFITAVPAANSFQVAVIPADVSATTFQMPSAVILRQSGVFSNGYVSQPQTHAEVKVDSPGLQTVNINSQDLAALQSAVCAPSTAAFLTWEDSSAVMQPTEASGGVPSTSASPSAPSVSLGRSNDKCLGGFGTATQSSSKELTATGLNTSTTAATEFAARPGRRLEQPSNTYHHGIPLVSIGRVFPTADTPQPVVFHLTENFEAFPQPAATLASSSSASTLPCQSDLASQEDQVLQKVATFGDKTNGSTGGLLKAPSLSQIEEVWLRIRQLQQTISEELIGPGFSLQPAENFPSAFVSSASSGDVVDQQKASRLSKLRDEHASLSSLARMLICDRLDALYEQTESSSAVSTVSTEGAISDATDSINGRGVARCAEDSSNLEKDLLHSYLSRLGGVYYSRRRNRLHSMGALSQPSSSMATATNAPPVAIMAPCSRIGFDHVDSSTPTPGRLEPIRSCGLTQCSLVFSSASELTRATAGRHNHNHESQTMDPPPGTSRWNNRYSTILPASSNFIHGEPVSNRSLEWASQTEIHQPPKSKVSEFMNTPPAELCVESHQNAPDGLRHANNSVPANLHLEGVSWEECLDYVPSDSLANCWDSVRPEGDTQVYALSNPSTDRPPLCISHNSGQTLPTDSSRSSAPSEPQAPVSQASCAEDQSHFNSLSFEEQSAMCADLLANYDPSSPFTHMDEDSRLSGNVSPSFLLDVFPEGLPVSSTSGPDRISETSLTVYSQDRNSNHLNQQYHPISQAKTLSNCTTSYQDYGLFRPLDNACKVTTEFCSIDSFMDLS
ncbi:hypothetical protein AAHC03_013749 [Spirometra sp. Aus1]